MNINDYSDYDLILVNGEPFNMMNYRIKQQFERLKLNDPSYLLYNLTEEQIICIAEEPEDIGYQYLYEIIPNIISTSKRRMISYFEQIIRNSEDSNIKEYMIEAKYYLTFLNPKLENFFIQYNFQNIPNRFVEEIKVNTVVSADTENYIRDLYAEKFLNKALNYLFDIDNLYCLPYVSPLKVEKKIR